LESAPINKAIERTHQEINLIREYRERLIADVVTGQFDVRGWMPRPGDMIDDLKFAALGDADDQMDEGDNDEDE
jgi:type I restriction enzyme, S subunit